MTTNSAGLTPTECVRILTVYRHRWMIPTLVCAVLATGYALFMPRYWSASQALVVRGEVSSSSTGKPGKFADLYEMRTFQETILELAKSRQVLADTLKGVAQAETGQGVEEPTLRAIESFRTRVDMRPPGGAEFGKTEIFYLSVKDRNRERAARLVDALRQQLDIRLKQLRSDRSQGLIEELENQTQLVRKTHEAETQRLLEFESEVGTDLGELRMLHSANSGQSDLRQQAVNLKTETRFYEVKVHETKQLLTVLQAAQQAPEKLVAMPSSLLASQPTLGRLKDGLVDAQLRSARLGGTRTAAHPQVKAAIESVDQIRDDLHRELQVAVQGVEIELNLNQDRYATLNSQLESVQQRLENLADRRVEYSNRVSAVENSRLLLDQAQKQLSELQAAHLAASSASLVTPVDSPEVGSSPIGLGRASVLAIGSMGGLVIGLGWVFLTVVPATSKTPEPLVSQTKRIRPAAPPVYQNATFAAEAAMRSPAVST
ncbi:MAG: hypothetical protein KDA57_10605 [Planctomycetales bacterium]|nr:hypothetical protein [Planctomycetales bacterium]